MAHRALKSRLTCPLFIGAVGDMGTITYWMSRRSGPTAMLKEVPAKPATNNQKTWRAFFGQQVMLWRAITVEQKAAYESVTLILHFQLTGYDLFMKCALRRDWRDSINAERLTGIVLWRPS